MAWGLAVKPDPSQTDRAEALVLARKAVAVQPMATSNYNTLALAEIRCGHWTESISASEQSMKMRNGGDASDWFLLALAHGQKGDKEKARAWFDRAVVWTKEHAPGNTELRQFWTEAAALLESPGPAAALPRP